MKKIVIEIMSSAWGYLVRVVEQTATGREFAGDDVSGSDKFTASNGFALASISSPSGTIASDTVYVRGSYGASDNSPFAIPATDEGRDFLARLIVAVSEYNAKFNPRDPLKPPFPSAPGEFFRYE